MNEDGMWEQSASIASASQPCTTTSEAVGRAEGVVVLTVRYMGRSHNFQSSILIERSGKIVRTVQK